MYYLKTYLHILSKDPCRLDDIVQLIATHIVSSRADSINLARYRTLLIVVTEPFQYLFFRYFVHE